MGESDRSDTCTCDARVPGVLFHFDDCPTREAAEDAYFEALSKADEPPPLTRKEAGIVLVVRDDERVLVVTNRRYGGKCLPGGKVDSGETPRIAAARELSEECGCFVMQNQLALLCVGESATETGRVVYCYLARLIHGTPRGVEAGTEVSWMTLDELVASPPFGPFYAKHFPDGLRHLRPTQLL